jgi:hypothetical protein
MDSIKINKISEENMHEEESSVRNSLDEDMNCCIIMLGCSSLQRKYKVLCNEIEQVMEKERF